MSKKKAPPTSPSAGAVTGKESAPAPSGRGRLNVESIVAATLRIVDAEGVDEVSMRRVASELGTGPASLYAHVANKDELLGMVLDKVLAELPVPDDPDWRAAMRNWARATRAIYRRHRDLAKLAFAHTPSGERMLDVVEALLTAMTKGGSLPPQVASWGLDTMSTFIAADVYEEHLMSAGSDVADAAEDEAASEGGATEQMREALTVGFPGRYPVLLDNLDVIAAGRTEERFDFGVDVIITGLEAHARAEA